MPLQKDRRGVDKAWQLVDAGKLPEEQGKARYYNGQVWLNDAVNGVFPLAPQGAGGSGALTAGLASVDFGVVGHSVTVDVPAPSILAGDRPLVSVLGDDDGVAMQDWDAQVISVTAGVGFRVQVSVIKGVAHGLVKFHWGF